MPFAKWTIEEYHRMIEAGIMENRLVQLLNGNLNEMDWEKESHLVFRQKIADYLAEQIGDRGIILQGQPITIPSKQSEAKPDITIVQPLEQEYLQHHPYPEHVMVLIEISCRNIDTDLELKRRIYAMGEIDEYWVVDLNSKKPQLWIYRTPLSGDYCLEYTVRKGEFSPTALPEATISIEKLLELCSEEESEEEAV